MHIVLLSGGSGKRMWPLSNDIRSKQFIKLFKREDGEYESMVQRVYRQIKTVDPEADVTIATSKTQASAIHNQLGEQVSLCVEPSRRDTFPAITLATAYLHFELGVDRDEVLIICPVDPYVDNSYYELVARMSEISGKSEKNLTLMGVKPTYPSEKYGYILPMSEEELSGVKAFKEKPELEEAKQYIKEGALWNAGVFAFKLGYLLDKAHTIIDFKDYRDLYNNYDKCTKTSFDYAIVEKENSVQVLRHTGEWKDVGTWNMMAEVMADNVQGNAMLDDTSERTNVVNELDIPILIMGAKDMVIAASSDGILIADKEQSSYMKPYVEKISTEARYAEKSWGSYSVIDAGKGYLSNKVVLNPGSRMSYHSHEFRDEVWTVLSGTGKAIIDGMEQLINPGDVVTMAAGCKHTVIANTELVILEAQLGDIISVKDKKKYNI